jgi:hypothetical protein
VLRQLIPTAAGREPKKLKRMPDDAIRPKVTFVKKGEGISTPNEEWGYFHEKAPEDGYVIDTGAVTGFVSEKEINAARGRWGNSSIRLVNDFVPEEVPEREDDSELEEWLDSRWYKCGCEKAGYAPREYPAWKYAEWERTHTNGRTWPVDWPDGWGGGRCRRCGTLIRVIVDTKENEEHNGR